MRITASDLYQIKKLDLVKCLLAQTF